MSDKPKKRIRCTKNLIAFTRDATQTCYNNAKKIIVKRHDIKDEIDLVELFKDEIDQAYRHQICKLPTDTLEAIILCHQKGRFHRAKITLQSITDELTRRALLDDSSAIK